VGDPVGSIVLTAGAGTGPGCVIWKAGALLARLFVQVALLPVSSVQPAIVGADSVGLTQLPRLHGAHVLELGAGTGVAGITAATCGAHVLLTDLPAAQSLLQANITRNQALIQEFGGSAAAAVLDWDTQRDNHAHHPVEEQQHHQAQAQAQPGAQQGNSCSCTERLMIADTVGAGAVSSMATLSSPTWDWGCGADLVFNASQVEPVVQAIRCFVRAGAGKQARSRTFLLAHKQRHADVDQQLLGALSAAGCLVSTVHWGSVVPEMEQQQLSQVCLWAIQHHPV
jgi:predicted nicotinamide N-methyase